MAQPLNFEDVTIDRIVEDEYGFDSIEKFFPTITQSQLEESREWMRSFGVDERDEIILCFQSYVVRTPDHTILVDSCVGKDKLRPTRRMPIITHNKWMEQLSALGLTVEDIDIVMCTHLHVDHVGWNTRLLNGQWVPTFPNATYLFSEKEFLFWKARNKEVGVPYFEDSVAPVVARDRHRFVNTDAEVSDHVRLIPTPGHTIDHFSVAVGNGRDAAVVTGDLLHSPLQVRYPELAIKADFDPDLAAKTRRSFFDRYADTQTICCTSHFPSPSRVRLRRRGGGFDFDLAD